MSRQNPNPCCKCTDPQYYLTLNAQGPQGITGKAGADGFSPTIEVVNNDYSNYQLRVTNATSSFTTPNLKANLPSGGNTGQILTKNSDTNGDYVWLNISSEQLPNNILLNNKPLQILNEASIITDQSLNSYIAAIDGIEDESGYCNGAILTPNGLTLANFSSDGILIAEQGFGLTTKNIQAGENIFFSYTEDNPQKLVISGTAAPYTLPQATAAVLGGVKAETKTDDDTQPVRIDTATGLLYTAAGGVPNVLDGGNASSVSATTVINNISQQTDTNDYPQINTVEETISITTPEPEETT